ncbi:galactose-specific lectin nattectin-like isoform X3 [Perca fluviatilis]|uniref:galactose-specific lectin nattectin-like isoform X3 n=1 Tax=Perca fluviatilis TaxID=8168 RepID=UPI00196467FA|nr:galactose-specific lectin nattectin-like isoform X3 [Perca fluviatilis]
MLTLFNVFPQMASGFPFALLLCLSIGLLAASGEALCPPGWTQFGSRCFAFYTETKSWIDAENFCISAGGNLASIHSDEEQTFLKDFIKQVTGAYADSWIGGFDSVKEGTWMWADGSKFNYNIWAAGQPDNFRGGENCLVMNWGAAEIWNDGSCNTPLSFVCSRNLYVYS